MSSPTPIITPPPKNKAKASFVPQGLIPARDVLKQYSTWVLAIIIAGPDMYQAATSLGMLADEAMPEAVKWAIRGLGGFGLLVKFISQRKPA